MTPLSALAVVSFFVVSVAYHNSAHTAAQFRGFFTALFLRQGRITAESPLSQPRKTAQPIDNRGKRRQEKTADEKNIGNTTAESESELEKRLRSLIIVKDWNELQKVLSTLSTTRIESGGRNVVFILSETMRRAKDISMIIPLLSKVTPEIALLDCTEDDIMPLLSEYAEMYPTSMEPVMQLVNYLAKRNVMFTAKGYSVLIKGYGRAKNKVMVDKVVQLCEASSESATLFADVILLNSIMDAYVRCGESSKAEAILSIILRNDAVGRDAHLPELSSPPTAAAVTIAKMFLENKVRADIITYNTLLKSYRYSERFTQETGQSVLRVMADTGVPPDQITINTLVDLAARKKLTFYAESLLESEQYGHLPGVEGFTSLISAHAQRGSVSDAFRVLGKMQNVGILPNAVTCTAIMEACMLSGSLELARTLLTSARELYQQAPRTASSGLKAGLEPNTLSPRANAYHDDLKSKFNLGKKLPKGPLTALYDTYIIGICKTAEENRDDDLAELYATESDGGRTKLLREAQARMIEMESLSLRPDLRCINSFLQALCIVQSDVAHSRVQAVQALSLLGAIREAGYVPDSYTNSILLTAMGRSRYCEQSLQYFSSLSPSAGTLNTVAANALLRTLADGADSLKAAQLFYYLKGLNKEPENDYEDSDDGDVEMRLSPVSAAVSAATAAAVTRLGTYEGGSQTYDLAPDVITYNILFQAIAKSIEKSPSFESPGFTAFVNETEYEYRAAPIAAVTKSEPPGVLSRALQQLDVSNPPQNADYLINLFIPEGDATIIRRIEQTKIPSAINELVESLFRDMRFRQNIQPDERFVNTLNDLFSSVLQTKPGIFGSQVGFKSTTARLIFEELVILGIEPAALLPVMAACRYSLKQKSAILSDEDGIVQRLRSSSASNRIFRKYRWNEMKSGWAGFF